MTENQNYPEFNQSLLAGLRAGDPHKLLMPDDPDKDTKHRVGRYLVWLKATGRSWVDADLAAHRDYLRDEGISPVSISAHLSTVRARYAAVLRDPATRDRLYALTPRDAPPSDRKAFVDEIVERLRNLLDPASAPVDTFSDQDVPDAHNLRLTPAQAKRLMQQPGIDTLVGMRDTAILALFLCTGIREAELCGLNVSDLRERLDGELSIYVRQGKGRKRRLVPYGELDWVLAFVEIWLINAGIETGPVFRGFYKGYEKMRPGRISKRAIGYVLERYPITIDGEMRVVQPHDLRRTYARRLYDAGVELNRIRQNLGHTSIQTTLGYIGDLDASERRPPSIFDPPYDLGRLSNKSG
ncbi:MAG: tyrosine-type recombinase/integrase [Aggregatilineales bacterium]